MQGEGEGKRHREQALRTPLDLRDDAGFERNVLQWDAVQKEFGSSSLVKTEDRSGLACAMREAHIMSCRPRLCNPDKFRFALKVKGLGTMRPTSHHVLLQRRRPASCGSPKIEHVRNDNERASFMSLQIQTLFCGSRQRCGTVARAHEALDCRQSRESRRPRRIPKAGWLYCRNSTATPGLLLKAILSGS